MTWLVTVTLTALLPLIGLDDDDPQLAAAIKLARQGLRSVNK